MGVSSRARHGVAALAGLIASLLLPVSVRACVNDGTPNPCRCLMVMTTSANAVTYAPVGTPTLSGLAGPTASPLNANPAATFNATVGDTFYDYNGDGKGNVTINVGDTVTWNSQGFSGHTVSSLPSDPEQFDSGVMLFGDSFSHTFNTAGTYTYYCQIHSFVAGGQAFGPQVGTITVVAPEPGSAAMVMIVGAVAGLRRRRGRAATND